MSVTLASMTDTHTVPGMSLDAQGLPTLTGSAGPEQQWLVATVFCGAPAGLPENSGGDGNLVHGPAVVVTTPTMVCGVIGAHGEGLPRLAFSVPLADVMAKADGYVGLATKRPGVVELEHADWVMRAQGVVRSSAGATHGAHAETEFLAALRTGRAPEPAESESVYRKYLPQLAVLLGAVFLGVVVIVAAAVWPIVIG